MRYTAPAGQAGLLSFRRAWKQVPLHELHNTQTEYITMKKTLITLLALAGVACAYDFETQKTITLDVAATQILKDTDNTANPWANISWNSSENVDDVLRNNADILNEGWHYFNVDGSNTGTPYVYDSENQYHTFKKVDGQGAILTFTIEASNLMSTEYDTAAQVITSISVLASKNQIWDTRWGVYAMSSDGEFTELKSHGNNVLGGTNATTQTTTVDSVTLTATDKIVVLMRTGSDAGYSQVTGLSFSASGMVVPEPATATLSLLALAGLAARRRRH